MDKNYETCRDLKNYDLTDISMDNEANSIELSIVCPTTGKVDKIKLTNTLFFRHC